MKKTFFPTLVSVTMILLMLACSLPSFGGENTPETGAPPAGSDPGSSGVEPGSVMSINYPSDPATITSAVKDEVHPSNYGDEFSINLYERPFQLDNTYRPDADIAISFLSDEGNWLYFSTQVMGFNPATGQQDISFGFEMDTDLDGRGDYLLWAYLPYSTTWTNTNTALFADFNNDVGSATPLLSDPRTDPPTDGYETLLEGFGSSADPEAVWVRQAPLDPTYLQIAVKRDAIDAVYFLWWAWTDFGLNNLTQMDYNDFYTASEAGSPYASDPNYPPNLLYGMDNTCRAPYNFTPVGNEPGLCGGGALTSIPTTQPGGDPPPGIVVLVQQTPTNTPPASITPTNTKQRPASEKGIITGFVYWDMNGDGVQDSGETGESSQPVYLYDAACHTALATTMPGADGSYSFTNLAYTTYCVMYAPPPGYNLGAPGGTVSGVSVNDVMPSRVDFRILPPG